MEAIDRTADAEDLHLLRGMVPGQEAALSRAMDRLDRRTPGEWAWIGDRLLAFTGAGLIGSGVIYLLAFNWDELGRFLQLGMVLAAVALAGGFAIWRGTERIGGQAALIAAWLLTGGLLALIGQTYQTGADPWQLFAAWSALTLPWAVAGRMAVMWVLQSFLWVTTAGLWWAQVLGPSGDVGDRGLVYLITAILMGAWGAWEAARLGVRVWAGAGGAGGAGGIAGRAAAAMGFLSARWPLRLWAFWALCGPTFFACWNISETDSLLWGAWLLLFVGVAGSFASGRALRVDRALLGIGTLPIFVVTSAAMARVFVEIVEDAGDVGELILAFFMLFGGLIMAGEAWAWLMLVRWLAPDGSDEDDMAQTARATKGGGDNAAA